MAGCVLYEALIATGALFKAALVLFTFGDVFYKSLKHRNKKKYMAALNYKNKDFLRLFSAILNMYYLNARGNTKSTA